MRSYKKPVTRLGLRLASLLAMVGLGLGLIAPHLVAAEPRATSSKVTTHVVASGDTLWGLAKEFGSGRDPRAFIYDVQRLNGLDEPSIYPGQKLILPSG